MQTLVNMLAIVIIRMGFAPKNGGEVTPYNFTAPNLNGENLSNDFLSSARNMAHDFWERVSRDERISTEFREFLTRGNPINRVKPKLIS